jgi:hypothetical protein
MQGDKDNFMELEGLLINIALSSTTAALISVILSHYFQTKFFKSQAEAGYIQAKVRLYSLILFYIEKMRLAAKALGHGEEKYVFKEREIDGIIRELNDAVKEKLDLINPEALKNWLELQTIIYREPALERMKKLRELILQEYNTQIIPRYRKIVGEEPRQLTY